MIEVPAELYMLQAAGKVSAAEVVEIEKMASMLDKVAALPLPHFWSDDYLGRRLGNALLAGGATAVGSLGAYAAGKALSSGATSIADKLTFKRDLNRLLEVHPDIKENYSEKDQHLAYKSLRMLNPKFAKDPLVGGNLLRQVLKNRDPQNPSQAPMLHPEMAVNLSKAYAERERSDAAPGITDLAVRAGVDAATHKKMLPHFIHTPPPPKS